jgi:hypothetical protein
MNRRMSFREFNNVRRRREIGDEQRDAQAEIAVCECGAQVRFHPARGWVHAGPCGQESRK